MTSDLSPAKLRPVKHLLVTNDFPPKVGGIQSYLWELWRRLPSDSFQVLTTAHRDGPAWDAEQRFHVERSTHRVLVPTPQLVSAIREKARSFGAELVVLDPALPLGMIGPHLEMDYAVIAHGAEITLPGHVIGSRQMLTRVLSQSSLVIAAGEYVLEQCERLAARPLQSIVIPPGVDTERFVPIPPASKREVRASFGLPSDGLLIVSVSRLVPRKGMDTLIRASARLAGMGSAVQVAIAGTGRSEESLRRLAIRTGAPVAFLGAVPHERLAQLYGCADVFAMMCHDRWMGLEAEGFGIVFLEAAATGVPQVAGRSGGSAEAVENDVTGLVVDRPDDELDVANALRSLLSDDARRRQFGVAARQRAVAEFSYDLLSRRLGVALGCEIA